MKINRNFYLLLLVGEYVKYSLFLTWLTSLYSFRWCCHLRLRGNAKTFLINLVEQLSIIFISESWRKRRKRCPKTLCKSLQKELHKHRIAPCLPLPHKAAVMSQEPGIPVPFHLSKNLIQKILRSCCSPVQRIFHLGKSINQNILYIYVQQHIYVHTLSLYIYICVYIWHYSLTHVISNMDALI